MAPKVGLKWPPPPPISVRDLIKKAGAALVLSGGGAKGSFEVGALQYLYNTGFRPKIICSTSVGSVNGLKLAEGEGTQYQGLKGLEKIWLNMKSNSDMFVEDSWFSSTPRWIKEAIDGSGSSPDWFQTLLLVFIPGLAADKLSDLADFVETGVRAHGMYNLQPIQELAKRSVNFSLLGNIRLRMATVGLKSGAVKYVTEKGRLLSDPTLPSDHAGSAPVDVILGMLASAAIPLFFEMQHLGDDWYVDGGLRQIAPIGAAIEMGASEVYAVIAPTPLAIDTDYTNKGLVDIGTRAATDITIDQILTDNIAPLNGWNVPVTIIRPTFEVESSRTIDPGLIRINMAYGFMRAYEILSKRPNERPDLKTFLISLSDEIARARRQIWQAEQDTLTSWLELVRLLPPEGPASPRDYNAVPGIFIQNLTNLRELKNALLGLIVCRASIAGPESMPNDPNDWVWSWEAHPNDYSNFKPDPQRYNAGLIFGHSPWVKFSWPLGALNRPAGEVPAEVPEPTLRPGGCPQFP
jgi:NTE family protein